MFSYLGKVVGFVCRSKSTKYKRQQEEYDNGASCGKKRKVSSLCSCSNDESCDRSKTSSATILIENNKTETEHIDSISSIDNVVLPISISNTPSTDVSSAINSLALDTSIIDQRLQTLLASLLKNNIAQNIVATTTEAVVPSSDPKDSSVTSASSSTTETKAASSLNNNVDINIPQTSATTPDPKDTAVTSAPLNTTESADKIEPVTVSETKKGDSVETPTTKAVAPTPKPTTTDETNSYITTTETSNTDSIKNSTNEDEATSSTPKSATTTDSTEKTESSSTTHSKAVEGLLPSEILLDPSIQFHTLEKDFVTFLRKEFIFPQVNREAYNSTGLRIERGLLVHGSCFETLKFVNGFGNELTRLFGKPARIFARKHEEVFTSDSGEAEKILKKIDESVQKCEKDTPIVILIEDLRSFMHFCDTFKKMDGVIAAASLCTALKTYLGDESKYQKLFCIVTVDELKVVPDTLMGPGLLAKTLENRHPDNVKRKSYLTEATKKWNVPPSDKLLEEMANKAEGFCSAKLHQMAQLAFEAGLNDTIPKQVKGCCCECPSEPSSLKADPDALKSINPTTEHWEKAFKQLQKNKLTTSAQKASTAQTTASTPTTPLTSPTPTAQTTLPAQTAPSAQKAATAVEPKTATPDVDPNITFASVGGLDEQIKYLRENIILPLKQKDVLKEWGVEPVRGIIFHGPPGTGKTLLAKAMANELNKVFEDVPETSSPPDATNLPKKPTKKYSFFYRKSTDCFNKYVGESERILRELFSAAEKQAPSLIFFDEFDGLCPSRGDNTSRFYTGIVTTLLGLMDSVKRGEILVIAATNQLTSLDPAIRRAGRFDRAVGFPLPGKEGREVILQVHTKSWKNGNSKEILEQLAERTVGYCGADLEHLCRETLVLGMQRFAKAETAGLEVRLEDWYTALSQVKASSNSEKNAFGSSSTFLQQVPPGVKALLQTNVKKIEEKMESMFTDVKDQSKVNGSGGLNSFLISSNAQNGADVDSYVVPFLLTESKPFKDVAPYTLDLSDIRRLSKDTVQSTLAQLRHSPDGKTPLLLVPQIDTFVKMKGSAANVDVMVDYVLTQLQTLRGKNVIVLATSKLELIKMQQIDEMVNLFKDVEGSKSHEFVPPSVLELTTFFKTIPRLETDFAKQMADVVKLAEGKDFGTLLDLYAELQRILQHKKVDDEGKTDAIILQQLTSSIKAFGNHKRKTQNQFDLYI